jgi:cobalamin synthase
VAVFFFGFPRFKLQGLLSISGVSLVLVSVVAVLVVVAEKSQVLLGVSGDLLGTGYEYETLNLGNDIQAGTSSTKSNIHHLHLRQT